MEYEIAIIVPVYNVRNYIINALNSILNQTMDLSKIQVILVDDNSDDGSEKIIDEYCDRYPNFYSIHLDNNTGSAAIPRNIGIKFADSNYLMFLDPDDEFSKDYCEVMYNAIVKNDVDVVKSNFIHIKNRIEFRTPYFEKGITQIVIKNSDEPLSFVAIWNGIHKRKLIIDNEIYFPNCLGEDMFFSVSEFLNMDKMIYLNDYFGYKYFNRDNSHAKSASSLKIENIIWSFVETKNLCKKFNRVDIINIVLGQQIQGIFTRIANCNESLTNKINLLKKVYDMEYDIPDIEIPSKGLKFVNFLLMKKLFLLSFFSLKLIGLLYNSQIVFKLLNLKKFIR